MNQHRKKSGDFLLFFATDHEMVLIMLMNISTTFTSITITSVTFVVLSLLLPLVLSLFTYIYIYTYTHFHTHIYIYMYDRHGQVQTEEKGRIEHPPEILDRQASKEKGWVAYRSGSPDGSGEFSLR